MPSPGLFPYQRPCSQVCHSRTSPDPAGGKDSLSAASRCSLAIRISSPLSLFRQQRWAHQQKNRCGVRSNRHRGVHILHRSCWAKAEGPLISHLLPAVCQQRRDRLPDAPSAATPKAQIIATEIAISHREKQRAAGGLLCEWSGRGVCEVARGHRLDAAGLGDCILPRQPSIR